MLTLPAVWTDPNEPVEAAEPLNELPIKLNFSAADNSIAIRGLPLL